MSKKRELLERAMSMIDYRYAPTEAISLHKEIREYLDQPEQEIACWGSFDLGGKCVGTHETRRLAAQIQGGNEVYPLFLKQERREPLSDDELNELADKYITDEACAGYFNGFRDAEKAHGIER